MKDINYYKSVGIPFPKKGDFVYFQVNSIKDGSIVHPKLSTDKLIEKGFSTVSRNREVGQQELNGETFVVIYHCDEVALKAREKAYADKTSALLEEFEHDLAVSEGLDPISDLASLIFNEAWEHGHSAGLHEVSNHYDSVADFAQRVIETTLVK